MDQNAFNQNLAHRWSHDPRWKGIARQHTPDDVWRLAGSVRVEHTLASEVFDIFPYGPERRPTRSTSTH